MGEAISLEAMQTQLLEVVSDKTGYPVEMLELDMDTEADLGIDSLKRVEIVGALCAISAGLLGLAQFCVRERARNHRYRPRHLPVRRCTAENIRNNCT